MELIYKFFVSEEGWPEHFRPLMVDEVKIGELLPITEDSKVKTLAIIDLRKEIEEAVSRLSKRDDNNES